MTPAQLRAYSAVVRLGSVRAAAAELNRLRQHLRRIVLVSHQEDFADQFPVVIRLATGENGTVATAVRK